MSSTETGPENADDSLKETLAPDGASSVRSPHGRARGTTLGRYVILSRLGAGAMGEVYEAFDPDLERKVALKVMRGGDRTRDDAVSQGSARLLREARAMARLVHPNVITIFDVGIVEGQVFLAMELIDGMTLTRWLEQPNRSTREVLEVLCAAGRGLAAAHDAGIVHRDFKPDNVLVGTDGRAVVLDFGLATPAGPRTEDDQSVVSSADDIGTTSSLEAARADLTATGAVMGTPAYMPPEQHAGRDVDARADQFAFCVCAYEALCGRRPFEGDSLFSLAANVIDGNVLPFTPRARIPRRVGQAVLRGLAPRREDRWPSMIALIEALSRRSERRRWQLALGGAVVASVAGVFGYGRWNETRRVAACADNEHAFDGAWDASRREEVRASFERMAPEHGSDWFRQYDATLSRYREDWIERHRRACVERGPQADLQVLCLDQAHTFVEAFSEALDAGSPQVLDAALMIEGMLPDLEPCSDPDELVQRFPLPPQEHQREQVTEVRRRLGRIVALARFDRLDDLGEAERVLARAQEIGYEAIVAEAQIRHAAALADHGRFDEAEARYWDALATAHRSNHHRAVAQAWTALVFLVGHEQARPDEVLRWLPLAEAAVEVGGSTGLQTALEANVGAVHTQRGDPATASVHYERALAYVERVRGPESVAVLNHLNNVGTTRAMHGDLDGAIAYFERALAIRSKTVGEEHVSVAHVLHNIGFAHVQAGRSERGRDILERALAIREGALPGDHTDIAKTLWVLGGVHLEGERYAEALPLLERALAIWSARHDASHPLVAEAETKLAAALAGSGRHLEAIEHARAAVASRRAAARRRPAGLAGALERLAELYVATDQLDAARSAAEEALEVRETERSEDVDGTAKALRVLAEIHRARAEPGAAREHLRRALALPDLSEAVARRLRDDLEALDAEPDG